MPSAMRAGHINNNILFGVSARATWVFFNLALIYTCCKLAWISKRTVALSACAHAMCECCNKNCHIVRRPSTFRTREKINSALVEKNFCRQKIGNSVCSLSPSLIFRGVWQASKLSRPSSVFASLRRCRTLFSPDERGKPYSLGEKVQGRLRLLMLWQKSSKSGVCNFWIFYLLWTNKKLADLKELETWYLIAFFFFFYFSLLLWQRKHSTKTMENKNS